MTKHSMPRGYILKLMILFSLPVLALFVAFFVTREQYIDGEKPTKDATKYLIDIKLDVLTKCVDKNSSLWIKVDRGNKKTVNLYAVDVDKFNKLLLGKDSLMVETMRMFPNHGVKWDRGGNCIMLPLEKSWNKSDYVKVPTWLMAVLIDEGVLNIKQPLE